MTRPCSNTWDVGSIEHLPDPPGADRKVVMRYTQLCKREREVVEFLSSQHAEIHEQANRAVGLERLDPEQGSDQVGLSRAMMHGSNALGIGKCAVDMRRRDVLPSRDFRLVYTLSDGAFSATVLSVEPSSEDGYFLLLASPEVKPADTPRVLPKTVIFVIDRSGSRSSTTAAWPRTRAACAGSWLKRASTTSRWWTLTFFGGRASHARVPRERRHRQCAGADPGRRPDHHQSIGICRYLEALHPEPNLFGRDAREIAVRIEMWTRRAEMLAATPLMMAVRHGHPALAALGDPGSGRR